MSLTTCAVRARVYRQDGTPDVGALVTATLNRFDVGDGFVGPSEVEAVVDADGVAILNLWPNELGATESTYKIRINGSHRTLNVTATVPNVPSIDLEDIATLPPYPGKQDGDLAVEVAVEHAGIAMVQAGIATTQAGIATAQAGIATTQAGVAVGSAAAAAASEAVALAARPTTSATPPANPLPNTEWIDEVTGRHYTWLADEGTWVEMYAAQVVDNPARVSQLEAALGAPAGAGKVGATWFGGVIGKLSDLATSAGAALIGFIQDGAGAVARSILDKLRDTVSAKDYGAVGDGVTNDRPAIQKALDTGKNVYLPNGIYRNGDGIPLKLATVGQKLIGESMQNTYLTSAGGSEHDLLRIAAALTEVTGILFRPGSSSNICVRIYAGWCYLHRNRFLAAAPQTGTAVVLTDQNPDTNAFVAGAYTHRIEGNHFGASGYTFARDIDDYSTNGITATKFVANQHLCDNAMRLVKGGGNLYQGNLYQSATGTHAVKVGIGLDFGAGVVGETVHGNYFELYSWALVSRFPTDDYQSFRATENHYDNVAQTYSATAKNFYHDDAVGRTELKNGWTDNYSSATSRVFNGRAGGTPILTFDDENKAIKVNKVCSAWGATLSYTADNQTVTPSARNMVITGAGGYRVGCILGIAGVQDGQELELLGITWPVTLISTNVRFAGGAASAQFGNTAGHVQAMRLIFHASSSTWYEVSRVTY